MRRLKLPYNTRNVREASHIDFVHEKRHMDVGGWGGLAPVWEISIV